MGSSQGRAQGIESVQETSPLGNSWNPSDGHGFRGTMIICMHSI